MTSQPNQSSDIPPGANGLWPCKSAPKQPQTPTIRQQFEGGSRSFDNRVDFDVERDVANDLYVIHARLQGTNLSLKTVVTVEQVRTSNNSIIPYTKATMKKRLEEEYEAQRHGGLIDGMVYPPGHPNCKSQLVLEAQYETVEMADGTTQKVRVK